MNKILKIAVGICIASVLPVSAQKSVKSINDGWSFKFPHSQEWMSVSLPHTYNLDAYSRRDYYKGPGEYRLNLNMPAVDPDRRYFLKFDAANKASELTVNGSTPMKHAGGYSAFCYDVTDLLLEGDNELRMTVDNSRLDVGPASADFTFWGGLYRDAWLLSTPLQHLDLCDNATSGVYVTPTNVSESSADVLVKSRLVNDGKKASGLKLTATLRDSQGREVKSSSKKINLKPGVSCETELTVNGIRNPALWSPESPTLYKLTVSLADAKSGEILDETETSVGFRWFSFDGPEGFKLNGKPYKLRGVNRHQDLAPVGVAMDDEAHRRDMRLIKDFGCNFVRIAHYPQDDAVLDECDRLGLIVWEEIPVVNEVPDVPGFSDNCEVNLTEMIRQHYNHPSVMMWGFMNEILLRAPSEDSPEWPATKERIVKLANQLETKLKEEDPTRASVMAVDGSERNNRVGIDVTDVWGWNLYPGWYWGKLSDFDIFLEKQHKEYPRRSLIISEWGAGSDRRLHSEKSAPFDFSMEYQQKFVEHYLPVIEEARYISGSSYWNFIDFNVAERQESMPRFNNKGLFYNNRKPKDVAYYFKSMWRKDIPVVHIAVRDRDFVVCDDDSLTSVKVYSNCPEVELTVNGVSAGRRTTDNCFALFRIQLPEGESALTAKGVLDGHTGNDAATVVRKRLPELSKGETLAINVGSDCDYTSSLTGEIWLADRPYVPGKWGYVDGKRRSTTAEIFSTSETPLYQTMLEGVTEYKIDAPAGRYEIELLCTDINGSSNNSPYLLGREKVDSKDADKRVRMRVDINGEVVEPEFTPSASGGYQHAVRRKYIIDNKSGVIDISLSPVNGATLLSGISLRRLI